MELQFGEEDEMAEEVREVRPVWEAEVPWVVAYLREDIQDLRNEVREVRRSVQRLDEKLDNGPERLDAKIDARTDGLDAKINGLDAKIDARTDGLDAKIEGLRQDMDAKIEGLRQDMGVQLRWIIGIVIGAMLTMTGVFAWIVDRMLTP